MNLKRPVPQSVQILCAASAPILWALLIGTLNTAAAGDLAGTGRSLFEHEWVAEDPLSLRGDGLGPMYNADSCVACHHQGAVGGAGAAAQNVSLLTVAVPTTAPSARERSTIQTNAGKAHPGFTGGLNGGASVMLHQFSTDTRYERWRLRVLGFKLPVEAKPSQISVASLAQERKRAGQPPGAELPRNYGIHLRLSQRNTPALFGAGLIDSIPDETLLELARRQAERFPGIKGRVGRTADGKVGRFGWRGQVENLREFVLTACSMELGL
jgi:CxxC motif-containing protein (DUF1111 family)